MAYNILIVDDSAVARSVIGKVILLAKIDAGNIFCAANGEEALSILKNNWIDIVFTDINMPVMNGIELIDRMACDGILNTVPVIIISTEGSVTRIDELKAKGVRGYIRKPFTPEKICEVMRQILSEDNPPDQGGEK